MNGNSFRSILELTRRLEEAHIWYRMNQVRSDALMIEVHVPGERWEIEFVDYGDEVHVEIERFKSDGSIEDESVLEDLFANFSDKAEPVEVSDVDGARN